LGPVAGDAFAVPAQQRVGGDDPAVAESAGERSCDRPEQAPVIIVEFGPVDLSAQNHELVAKHDDLEVLGASRPDGESSKCSQKAVEDAKHDTPAWRHCPWSAPTRVFPSPTGLHANEPASHPKR